LLKVLLGPNLTFTNIVALIFARQKVELEIDQNLPLIAT